MARSPEYPDLPWVPPRAWGRGRDGKAVRYIVIHYTAGSERATSAEDGAAYNQRRDDGTSAHYFVDSNTVVHCVKTSDRANCARHRGNRLGIQYELCGTVQTRAQWLDAASLPTLQNAARQVARDCRKYGIPPRRLTVAQTRQAWTEFPDGPKGIVGHVDCTYAYPEDGGDHTDPGASFPWDVFLDMVRDEIEEQDMPDIAEIRKAIREELAASTIPQEAAKETWAFPVIIPAGPGREQKTVQAYTVLQWLDPAQLDTRRQLLDADAATREAILQKLAEVADLLNALHPAPSE
jgi:N-acetyl-anhydromuramyl-L-alanine amidase AmpD